MYEQFLSGTFLSNSAKKLIAKMCKQGGKQSKVLPFSLRFDTVTAKMVTNEPS